MRWNSQGQGFWRRESRWRACCLWDRQASARRRSHGVWRTSLAWSWSALTWVSTRKNMRSRSWSVRRQDMSAMRRAVFWRRRSARIPMPCCCWTRLRKPTRTFTTFSCRWWTTPRSRTIRAERQISATWSSSWPPMRGQAGSAGTESGLWDRMSGRTWSWRR